MHKSIIEKGIPEYTRHIQRAPKGRPRKSTQKNPQDTQKDSTHSTKSNKGIGPSLIYKITQGERLQKNECFLTFDHFVLCLKSSLITFPPNCPKYAKESNFPHLFPFDPYKGIMPT